MSFVTRLVNNPFDKLLFLPKYHVNTGFFSEGEVDSIASYCNNLALNQGGLFTGEDIYNTRNAKTAFIQKPDGDTQWIYEKLNNIIGYYNDTMFGFELTGFDYIQYAEYDQTGKHEFHMDIALDSPTALSYNMNQNMRKLTIVLMLNQQGIDFDGGDFQINRSEERFAETVPMQKGSVLLLPSFILHRVTPVTRGLRKTLVCWVIGPKFK